MQITGDRQVALRFDKFPESARVNLRAAIDASTQDLWQAVQAAAPRKTGKLAASIQKRVTESKNKITGIVNVAGDFGKAGALEYGSHRTITMKLSHVFGHLVPTLEVKRTLNIEEHNFLRGPEKDMAPAAFEKMEAALNQVVDDA